jgi:hypothetical protein
MTEEKVRENRLRRAAERQGARLDKSRRRDPNAADYGLYWLINREDPDLIFGGQFGVTLDAIEEELTAVGYRRQVQRQERRANAPR